MWAYGYLGRNPGEEVKLGRNPRKARYPSLNVLVRSAKSGCKRTAKNPISFISFSFPSFRPFCISCLSIKLHSYRGSWADSQNLDHILDLHLWNYTSKPLALHSPRRVSVRTSKPSVLSLWMRNPEPKSHLQVQKGEPNQALLSLIQRVRKGRQVHFRYENPVMEAWMLGHTPPPPLFLSCSTCNSLLFPCPFSCPGFAALCVDCRGVVPLGVYTVNVTAQKLGLFVRDCLEHTLELQIWNQCSMGPSFNRRNPRVPSMCFTPPFCVAVEMEGLHAYHRKLGVTGCRT